MEERRPAPGREPTYTWDDTIAAIGKNFSGGNELVADETIEYTAVVRFCEPWEIGNPIHWDKEIARRNGYRDVVVPWSAIRITFSSAGAWRPGDAARFTSPDPNASGWSVRYQPHGEEVPMPPTRHAVVADMDLEFFEPVCVGDRLIVRGDKLVNVRPRKTRVGFGAFVTRQRRIYNQRHQMVAQISSTTYSYNPE